jgi:type VI secretion system secreted protein VgrG
MATTQKGRLLYLTSPLGEDYLLINKVTGREAISELYTFELEVLHEENEANYRPTPIDPTKILGKPLVVHTKQDDGGERYFNGLCIAFHQGKRDPRFSFYRATIVPDVWMLTRTTQSRIFQNKSVVDVLNLVLEGFKFDIEISQPLEPRNYIVQYRETDWDFISRLMEEEGIYYYFEHKADENRLIIADSPQSHRICPSKESLPYMHDISELGEAWVGGVHEWLFESRLQTGKLELRDYNFELQDNPLQAVQTTRFTGFPNQDMEFYDLPGDYAKRFDGINVSGGEQAGNLQKIFSDRERTARIRQEQMDADFRTISSWSDSAALIAGYRFKLTKHPMRSNNIYQIVVSSEIVAQQAPGYVTDDDVPEAYLNEFTCMPHGEGHAPFRPRMGTPRPVIAGSQTGIVVGPSGEEIFPDKYGRVKVHFHWDRLSKFDPEASCWLRVATNIAGNKWGTMFIPRVGQEVIIDFLDGDPDRPIITGSVYNPKTMPHYELPKFKTLTYIKTRTSPDDGKGYNELRFEDKANKEQVFIRSQKRMDVRVRGSLYETCGGSRNEVIGLKEENQPGGNLTVTVAGAHDFHIKEAQYIGVDDVHNETVKSDVVQNYQAKQYTEVTGARELNAQSITLEAKTKITLKVGASFITLDLSGVTIKGPMVKINSGGSASATSPADISDPMDAETSDTGEPGYLDKPRSGGGGGRRRRTLTGQHAPNVTDQAFALTRAGGHGDDLDRALVAAELSKLPPHILQRMEDNGTAVVVGRDSVTDLDPSLAGVTPRGWPAGTSWDTVPGLYNPNSNEVHIATRGHGTEDGPYVPPTGDGHGSSNLVIHESMHSVDDHGPDGNNISDTDADFIDARTNDPATMADGYEGTANAAGAEESYAESAARYYGDDPNDAANHPGLHDYWDNDPLSPDPPDPAGP